MIALMAAAVLLPVAVTLVVAAGFLFAGFHDAVGARALFAVALACGLLWAIALVALLLLLGFDSAVKRDTDAPFEESEGDEHDS